MKRERDIRLSTGPFNRFLRFRRSESALSGCGVIPATTALSRRRPREDAGSSTTAAEVEFTKKEIWLSIFSLQHFEGCEEEKLVLDTAATLYKRNGKYFIVYQESELTGLEGTQTTIKLDGKKIALTRTGAYASHMQFFENERQVGLYQSPIGLDLSIATHTSRVHNTVNEFGGELVIDYTIEIEHAVMGVHHFEMHVSVPQ